MEVLFQVIKLWLWVFVPHGAGVCTVAQLWQHSAMGASLLSPQKLGARSCGAPSKGALRQGWPWRWGTGWLVRLAGSRRMGAWTATALRESKQHLQLWCPDISPWNWLLERGTVSAVGPVLSEFPSQASVIDGPSLSLPLWLKESALLVQKGEGTFLLCYEKGTWWVRSSSWGVSGGAQVQYAR